MKIIQSLIIILFIVITSVNSQVCVVAQYDFNGNANDTTNNGHNGNVNGPTLIPDRFNRPNQAYSFDGINDQITIPDHPDLEGFKEMTIVFWMNLPEYDYDGSAKSIFQKWGSGPFSDRCYLFAYDSLKNYFIFQVYLDGVNTSYLVDIPLNVLPKHQWHMISGVFAGDSIHMYFDSLKVKSVDIPDGDSINKGSANVAIAREQGVNDYLRIKLDDIKIFNCALNQAQIDSVFHYDPFACSLDTTLSMGSDTIWSNEVGVKYRWISCTGDSLMAQDTMPYYIATTNGSYAVIMEKGKCNDTSECITITNVGVDDYNNLYSHIYPNPSSGQINIDFDGMKKNVLVEIYSINGRIVYSNMKSNCKNIHLSVELEDGLYLMKLLVDNRYTTTHISILNNHL